jgi:hypothetical protein
VPANLGMECSKDSLREEEVDDVGDEYACVDEDLCEEI